MQYLIGDLLLDPIWNMLQQNMSQYDIRFEAMQISDMEEQLVLYTKNKVKNITG